MPAGTRPQPPVDTVRVAFHAVNQGHASVNVMYLKLTTTGTKVVNDLASVIDALVTSWNLNVKTHATTACTFGPVVAVWITDVGQQLTYTNSVSQAGTAGTTMPDVAASFVVKWQITAYYRGGHPRTYLPGCTTTPVTNGSDVSAAEQSALVTSMNTFRNAVNALTAGGITSVQLGTVSFQTGNAWRTPPVFRSFIGCSVNPKLGTQRRRIHA